MPKQELTGEQAINQAIVDVHNALLENINASKAEVDAKDRKKKAHYTLLKAKERLLAVEREIMEII